MSQILSFNCHKLCYQLTNLFLVQRKGYGRFQIENRQPATLERYVDGGPGTYTKEQRMAQYVDAWDTIQGNHEAAGVIVST